MSTFCQRLHHRKCQRRAHCFVSSNSFHGQITQKAVHQISDPENKKCSHWNFFGTNHPQNLRFLSRRGPRSLDMGLSQHYIGSKMTFCHFSNFCRKRFPSLSKRLLHISIQLWGLYFVKNHVVRPLHSFNKYRKFLFSSLETFFCRNLENVGMSYLGQCNVEIVSCSGF